MRLSQTIWPNRATESLAENPRLGTKVEVPDGGAEELRQLVIAPYVMRYVVEIDRIVVLRLWQILRAAMFESRTYPREV